MADDIPVEGAAREICRLLGYTFSNREILRQMLQWLAAEFTGSVRCGLPNFSELGRGFLALLVNQKVVGRRVTVSDEAGELLSPENFSFVAVTLKDALVGVASQKVVANVPEDFLLTAVCGAVALDFFAQQQNAFSGLMNFLKIGSGRADREDGSVRKLLARLRAENFDHRFVSYQTEGVDDMFGFMLIVPGVILETDVCVGFGATESAAMQQCAAAGLKMLEHVGVAPVHKTLDLFPGLDSSITSVIGGQCPDSVPPGDFRSQLQIYVQSLGRDGSLPIYHGVSQCPADWDTVWHGSAFYVVVAVPEARKWTLFFGSGSSKKAAKNMAAWNAVQWHVQQRTFPGFLPAAGVTTRPVRPTTPVNFKSMLQEYVMKRGDFVPRYCTACAAPSFTSIVTVPGVLDDGCSGTGPSKRAAEQNAACEAYKRLVPMSRRRDDVRI